MFNYHIKICKMIKNYYIFTIYESDVISTYDL